MDDWKQHISFFDTNIYKKLLKFVKSERLAGKSILPSDDDILNALNYTSFADVKVVILGQDPYPNQRHAHGLAFSIPKSCKDIPRSLKNILKELNEDLALEKNDGNLEGWAKQGVLLLNTVLTVEEGKSNSHKNLGWEKLMIEILEVLNDKKDNIVFVLWGNHAKKLGKNIDRKKHHVIQAPHPSPLSARRGFFGSKPFSKINSYLRDNGIKEIDWE